MKTFLAVACFFVILTGCSTVKKQFTVIVDPPDSEIRVIPGGGAAERTYRSPAEFAVNIPKDPAEAAKSRMEIRRDTYGTRTINLDMVGEKKTIKIKLDKMILYRLKCRLIRPALSDDMVYRDGIVSVKIVPGERDFDLNIRNLTQKPLKILWDRAEYTDFQNRPHPLMHAGIKPQNRADIVPPQEIPPAGTVHASVFPKSSATYSQVLKDYAIKLLLPVYSDAAPSLKGRTFSVFLPLELDRAIIPDYFFKFEIVDVIKEE
jgi:hypothetical protein